MAMKEQPAPRSLQEWMQTHGINAERLRALVKEQTGTSISATMMHFILTGSRRCSAINAMALHVVTTVPMKVLQEWPKVSGITQFSGRRSKRVA